MPISFTIFMWSGLPACKTEIDVNMTTCTNIGKKKAIPLQAWTGPECSRRLRLPDFKTIGT